MRRRLSCRDPRNKNNKHVRGGQDEPNLSSEGRAQRAGLSISGRVDYVVREEVADLMREVPIADIAQGLEVLGGGEQ